MPRNTRYQSGRYPLLGPVFQVAARGQVLLPKADVAIIYEAPADRDGRYPQCYPGTSKQLICSELATRSPRRHGHRMRRIGILLPVTEDSVRGVPARAAAAGLEHRPQYHTLGRP